MAVGSPLCRGLHPLAPTASTWQDEANDAHTSGASPVLVADHHTLDQLQALAEAIPQKRSWRRVQAVLLAKQGWTAPDIARAWAARSAPSRTGSPSTTAAASRPSASGPGTGRPRAPGPGALPPAQAAARRPAHGPRTASVPSGPPTSAASSSSEFGVLMGLQAVYDLLHRLGYSSLMPRPQHEDANPEVQAFFKEIVVEQIDAIAAEHPERGGAGLLRGRGAVRHRRGRSRGSGPARARGPGRCGRTAASGCTC